MRAVCSMTISCVLVLACASDGDDDGAADTGSSTVAETTVAPTTTATSSPTTSATSSDPSTSSPTTTMASTTADDSDGSSSADGSSSSGDTGLAPGDCSAALFCEDFEDDAAMQPPGAPWTVSTQQGSLVVDDSMAYSGSQAVHIEIEGGEGSYRRAFMSIEGAPVFDPPLGAVWGRMMVQLVATPAGSVHWTNIQGEGEVPGMDFRALYRYGGQHEGRLMANYETQGVGSDCWQHSETVMPTGGWACFEWHFDQPTNTMEFFLDGTQLDDLTAVQQGEGCISHDTGDQWYAPIFDTMRLGWEHYQQSDAKELWIDDVALDVARIGCPD
jgi:hypothetical protein